MTLAADLDVAGLPVLVCGGGPEAAAAVHTLLDAGAEVTVVAPDAGTSVADLAARGLVTLHHRSPTEADVTGAALLVAATGDHTADAELAAQARAHGRPAVLRRAAERPVGGRGEVILVGGGPGDPGLITVAGLDAVRTADVVVSDRLAPLAVLREAPSGAEVIDVAKIPRGSFTPQERINALLVEHARAGRRVVRLKGGDNFVFGRGGEEWQACAAAGLPVRVIPGVSSATGVPALAGIPVTHRDLTQGFTVVSGHLAPGDPGCTLDWPALARANTTLVVLMGVATLPGIAATLIEHGLAAQTPAVTIADGGLPSQRSVRGALGEIAGLTAEAGIRPPAITVIGAVAGLVLNG